MSKYNIIEFKELAYQDSKELNRLMSNDSEVYQKYFVAFDSDVKTIENLLNKKANDLYIGIYWGSELIGFYMLRGFDEGYNIPSYGIWISSKFKNKGIAKLSLYHAISICKLIGAKKLMLKVHPDHYIKKAYEDFGFVKTGVDEKIGHLIYHLDVKS